MRKIQVDKEITAKNAYLPVKLRKHLEVAMADPLEKRKKSKPMNAFVNTGRGDDF